MATSLHGAEASFKPGLQHVAHRVYAWMQPNGSWGESNAGLVVGDGESLVVDTLWDLPLTRRMLGSMRHFTVSAPISVLVNTHSDGDHWFGNELVDAREIVTSERSLAIQREEDPRSMRAFEALGKGMAAAGRLPVPGRDDMRTVSDYFAAVARPFDWSGITPTPATRSFSGEEELEVGGVSVHLIEVGPAHTPGDLFVFVPGVRTLFAADIMFLGVTPVMWAGPVENWIAALDRILEMDVDVVVPGHGPVTDKDGVRAVRGYWELVDPLIRRAHGRGLAVDRAAEEVLLSQGFRDSEYANWIHPERVVVNVDTIYRELEGRGTQRGPRETVGLFRQVALLERATRGDTPR